MIPKEFSPLLIDNSFRARVKRPARPTRYYILLPPFFLVAIWFSWRPLFQSGALSKVLSECNSRYTGITPLDKLICANIAILEAAMDESNPPFLSGDVSSIAACAFIPVIESLRIKRLATKKLWNPLWIGLTSQLLGRGTTYPLWWAYFLYSESSMGCRDDVSGTAILEDDAFGALLACLIGFVVPGVAMAITASRSWILLWWMYPISIFIIQEAYRCVSRGRPKVPVRDANRSISHVIILGIHTVAFLYATTMHLKVLLPCVMHVDKMHSLLGLSFTVPDVRTTPLSAISYHSLQWDAVSLFGASVVASMFLTQNKSQALRLAVWNLSAITALGTGGALAGTWAWREATFKQARQSADDELFSVDIIREDEP